MWIRGDSPFEEKERGPLLRRRKLQLFAAEAKTLESSLLGFREARAHPTSCVYHTTMQHCSGSTRAAAGSVLPSQHTHTHTTRWKEGAVLHYNIRVPPKYQMGNNWSFFMMIKMMFSSAFQEGTSKFNWQIALLYLLTWWLWSLPQTDGKKGHLNSTLVSLFIQKLFMAHYWPFLRVHITGTSTLSK